jgi:hypothetical protein
MSKPVKENATLDEMGRRLVGKKDEKDPKK